MTDFSSTIPSINDTVVLEIIDEIVSQISNTDEMETVKAVAVSLTTHTINNNFVPKKMQDRAFVFPRIVDENGELFDAMYNFDGHGTSSVINTIDKIPLEEIAKLKYPLAEILQILDLEAKKHPYGFKGSGATYSLTRIYSNRIVVNYCGDCEVLIFKNGKKVLETIPHNVYNPSEMERIKKVCWKNVENTGKDLSLLSKTSVTMKESKQIALHNPTTNRYEISLGPTMAIGHNRITGYDFVDEIEGALPDYIIEYGPEDEITVVQGSDGVWDMIIKDDPEDINDMLTLNAVELVEKIRARWFQEWDYIADVSKPDKIKKTKLSPSNPDDISACVYRRVFN